MSFDLYHVLVSRSITPAKRTAGEESFFRVAAEGNFVVRYPGKITRRLTASFDHKVKVDDPIGGDIDGGGGSQPLHGGWQTAHKTIPLTLRIFDPDDVEFTAGSITLADLRKHRDLRGTPQGTWRYKINGESEHFVLTGETREMITNPKGVFALGLDETVASESAAPLIPSTPLDGSRQDFQFDLHREGTFVAELSHSLISVLWRGSMQLYDPDGVRVASSTRKRLECPISLAMLGKSRDAAGKVRPWRLSVAPQGGVVVGSPRISATVLGAGRIRTDVLHDRILKLIGPNGSFLKLYGENKDGDAIARLEITDAVAAETIDFHHLIDKALKKTEQDPDIEDPLDVRANVKYALHRRAEDLGYKTRLDVSTLKVESIGVSVGPSQRIAGAIPAVRLKLKTSGKVKVKLGPLTVADAAMNDGKFEMEIGIRVAAGGTPETVLWVPEKPFDIDVHWGVVLTAGAIAGPLLAFGVVAFGEYLEGKINEAAVETIKDKFADPVLACRVLMTVFGAHLTYRSIGFEGQDIVFRHVAPLEPDPRPREGYAGVIGRAYDELGPMATRFRPPTLGDTWKADNLSKIAHVVVVMMENRSYDHVLGYRALDGDGSDGLTGALIDKINAAAAPNRIRNLNEAAFASNALGLKTRLPRGVGHELKDVAQQLAGRVEGATGQINDPKGFVDNFRSRVGSNPGGVKEEDVLGYYGADQLKFFAYLARHYTYLDRYYCSHPGPTLPNRMYSLTGDVQYDRLGVPILDNNEGDNFLLSRELTIYDWLTKRGIPWRVYESFPSVTMLRFFARYATDNTNIVPIDRFAQDVANGDLPPFVAIEPSMHHHPPNDDHPPADMHRGQIFLKKVYDTLRSNPAIWQRTLLVITYDEHGGLYDHAIPPVADLLRRPLGGVLGDRLGTRVVVAERELAEVGGGTGGGGGSVVGGRIVDVVGRLDHVLVRDGGAGGTPPERPPEEPASMAIPYGVRVPTFLVSPWTMPGKGESRVLDHCSILKTVLARFAGGAKPFLSDRVAASQTFEPYLTAPQPRMDVPDAEPLQELPLEVPRLVPGASAIATPPLSRTQMRAGPVEFHELGGRLARMLGR